MALFRGIQEYIALDANNIVVDISGNIFLYPPQGHPILYNNSRFHTDVIIPLQAHLNDHRKIKPTVNSKFNILNAKKALNGRPWAVYKIQ